ncbi:MAG TPA: (2Fe-2S)-binding protein [Candidatus Limnocylindria bacterium]|nr:(2Fe-2S)-binding protein [Candidatus Limnocylindria bacterium]
MTDSVGPAPGALPAWERLMAPPGRRLRVGALREVALDVAVVRDGRLSDVEGVVVFDAWRTGEGRLALRAARLDGATATPYRVSARELRIEPPSDGQLERLLGMAAPAPPGGELERLACACVGVSADAVYRALAAGWLTVDALRRATKVGFGACQGRRCIPWLAARVELDPADLLAAVTPRPPLVPVPASILAAFGEPLPGVASGPAA